MEQQYKPIEWIEGNKISLALPLQKVEITPSGKVISDYVPDGTIEVVMKSTYKTYRYAPTLEGNLCIFADNGSLRAGTYAVEILSTEADGTKRRSQYPRVMIVHRNTTELLEPFEDFPDYAEGAVLDTASVFYFAKGDKGDQGLSAYEVAVENGFVGTEEEWLESLRAHIEDVYTREQSDERYVHTEDGKGLSANDYTDTEKDKLAGLVNYDDDTVRRMIAETNANFANYYTKQESYSANEIDTLLRTQRQGRFVVVQTLPDPSEDTMFRIYLVPKRDAGADNIKDEFITLEDGGDYAWEKIGSTKVDLSGYSTTAQMNAAIAAALDSYYDKATVDGMLTAKQDAINDLADIRSGAGKGATAYQKPATGIPSTDLSSAVQTSLGKADTAIQTETDPTVPSWAKQQSKPTYTASEVDAVPTTRTVNGKALSSNISLDASDVGALPSSTPIPVVPTNVGAFTNDAGYLTSHQDISGKEDKVTIESASGATLSAQVGKYYTLSSVGTLAITLPTIASGTTHVQTVVFYISAGSSPAVTFTSTHPVYYADGFEIAADSTYEINALWNGIAWVVALVKIVIPT